MKRLWSSVLGLLIVLAILSAGCGPKATPDEAVPPVEEEEAPPVEEEEAPPVEEEAGPLGPLSLQYATWTYDLEKVQQNQDKYIEWVATQVDPACNVTVERTEFGFGDFDTSITTTFTGGDTFDVMYSSDHWIAKWATAGWIIPVEDHFPQVRGYADDMLPFALKAMTFNGKIYALPYATSVLYFVYNQDILDAAGIDAPPTTWAEVTEQALKIKEAGAADAGVLLGLKASSWFEEYLFSIIYSEGGTMISDDLKAVFETDSGPVYEAIEWMASAVEDEIMPISALEMTAVDVQEAFKQDNVAFVIVPNYMLAEFAAEDLSAVAGHYDIALMPGSTHETNVYTRLYVMGSGALEDPATSQCAWNYFEFLGGKTTVDGVTDYHIAKRWAVANGVAFGPISLWDDPEVVERFSKVADFAIQREQDALARLKEGMSAPWYAEWISFVRTEVQKAILRQITTEQALTNIKQQWIDLAAE